MRELEKANRQLATLSLNDALTGLHNRRHMDNLLPELCAEARRTGQPLTIALLDADHFKTVNDSWGTSLVIVACNTLPTFSGATSNDPVMLLSALAERNSPSCYPAPTRMALWVSVKDS